MQLSLLQGSWLIKCSGDFARRRLPTEQDESICDYWISAKKIDGWYQAAVVLFPAVTLASFQDESSGSGVTNYLWTAEGADDVLAVQVLLGDAGSAAPAITDTSVLINRVDLRRGVAVAVIADAGVMDVCTRRVVEGRRARPIKSPRQALRYGWGSTGGVPGLIDLAG